MAHFTHTQGQSVKSLPVDAAVHVQYSDFSEEVSGTHLLEHLARITGHSRTHIHCRRHGSSSGICDNRLT